MRLDPLAEKCWGREAATARGRCTESAICSQVAATERPGTVLPAPAQQPDAEYGCRGASVTRRVWAARWEVGLTSIPARH